MAARVRWMPHHHVLNFQHHSLILDESCREIKCFKAAKYFWLGYDVREVTQIYKLMQRCSEAMHLTNAVGRFEAMHGGFVRYLCTPEFSDSTLCSVPLNARVRRCRTVQQRLSSTKIPRYKVHVHSSMT